MAPSAIMSKSQIVKWHDEIISKFETHIAEKAANLGEQVPSSKEVVSRYVNGYEKAVREIRGVLYASTSVYGAKLQPIADDAEEKLDSVMVKFEKALDHALETRNISGFDKAAFDLLREVADTVFDIRAETAKYRVASKEVEPQSIDDYVMQLIGEK